MPEETTYTLRELRNLMTKFIDEEYPKRNKKKASERGIATVAVSLFTCFIAESAALKKNNGADK